MNLSIKALQRFLLTLVYTVAVFAILLGLAAAIRLSAGLLARSGAPKTACDLLQALGQAAVLVDTIFLIASLFVALVGLTQAPRKARAPRSHAPTAFALTPGSLTPVSLTPVSLTAAGLAPVSQTLVPEAPFAEPRTDPAPVRLTSAAADARAVADRLALFILIGGAAVLFDGLTALVPWSDLGVTIGSALRVGEYAVLIYAVVWFVRPLIIEAASTVRRLVPAGVAGRLLVGLALLAVVCAGWMAMERASALVSRLATAQLAAAGSGPPPAG